MGDGKLQIPIKAIVFDLDGTLLDTAPDLVEATNRMRTELGMPVLELATVKSYIGNGIGRIVKRALTGDMQAEPGTELFAQALASFKKPDSR